MLRASSYTIYVELPNNDEEMLLVHGYTGAYNKVSRRVATYVRSLEAGEPPKPLYGEWGREMQTEGRVTPPSQETISVLKRRGFLVEINPQQEEVLFSKIALTLHARNSRPNYLFMPTYDCNLRCSYCFQDHMRTNPAFGHLLGIMQEDLVDRIFKAIPKIEAYHGIMGHEPPDSNIGFFGGEPLLERNHSIVKYIIDKARARGEAAFWAVTNGTELHAYRDLLAPDMLSYLQITLDGPAYEHDKRRIYADGRGSFELIAGNISMALDSGVQVSVRMNIDRDNIGHLPALAREIIERGWSRHPNFSASTAPVRAANPHTDAKTTFSSWELDQELTQMRQQYPDMRVIERPDDRIKEQVRTLFEKHGRPSLSSTFCGAHNGMYIFDSFGDIYACWERTGDSRVRIGSVTDGGDFILEEKLNTMWRSRNVTSNPICRKCRYALNCGGGCAVVAEGQRGEFFTNFCDGFATRFRAAVAEAYMDHVAGVEHIVRIDRGCDL